MNITFAHKIYYSMRTMLVAGFKSGLQMAATLFFGADVKMCPKGYSHSFLVRGNTSDAAVAFAIFVKHEYRTPYLADIDLILDLGANVGYSTIFFAHHYPEATIVALEPDEKNFTVLKDNTKQYSNIILLNAGVWWRTAEIAVTNPTAQSYEYNFMESGNSGIKGITINELLGKFGSSKKVMVKMDVEGAEKEVFEKDSSWIQKISVIQMEIHGCWKSIFDALCNYDYEARISGENVVVDLMH